jgi:hypothetical protein
MAPRWTPETDWHYDSGPHPDMRPGVNAFRGLVYALAVTAVMILAVLAILWWAL